MSETSSYGNYYWCVKVAKMLFKNGEIYLHAERVVLDRGAVVFISNKDCPVLVVPAGSWSAVCAASVIDGSAVAIEHWEGEVVRKGK
jgi:hypothetical protein